MKIPSVAMCIALVLVTGCRAIQDSGPVHTSTESVDAGAATSVKAHISMGAGSLKIDGGAPNLMTADFRYSEGIRQPVVRYDVTGTQGDLTVNSPKEGPTRGHSVNEWDLRMNSSIPLEATVALGAGESTLDFSLITLRSLNVSIGAGEVKLNVAGNYTKDVDVEVNGGVGSARIEVPRSVGAEIEVHGGLGSISAGSGLTKRDDKYYNDAYTPGKPAVHMSVHGGIGDVHLSVGEIKQSN